MNLKTTISKILPALLVALLFLAVPQATPAAVQPNLENSVQLPASSLDNTDNAVYQVAIAAPPQYNPNPAFEEYYAPYHKKPYKPSNSKFAILFSCMVFAFIIVSIASSVLNFVHKHRVKRKK